MKLTLPTDSCERKAVPLYAGCIAYFPAALAGVASHSKAGNDKHNPGEPLHHARGKSMDHEDCIVRHLTDIGDILAAVDRAFADSARMPAGEFTDAGGPEYLQSLTAEILSEADALSWRALALSQQLHERFAGSPLAPGARVTDDRAGPDFPDGSESDGFAPGFEERCDRKPAVRCLDCGAFNGAHFYDCPRREP